jgi:hypothetical protein
VIFSTDGSKWCALSMGAVDNLYCLKFTMGIYVIMAKDTVETP